MIEFLIQHEPIVRMTFFLGTLVAVAAWEILSPRRSLRVSKSFRWIHNMGVTIFNSFILRFLFPVLAVGFAAICELNNWGVLNLVNLPIAFEILIALIIQDLVIYFQHVLFHYVPLFWRFHKMHHADPDYDVTTGARFHPVEIAFSMVIKIGVVFLLGPPVIAVILFEIILSSMAMFNHANATLPANIDKSVRKLIVTPDMHRVHHSVKPSEHHRNFGFNLSIWDRLFRTYKETPDDGHMGMTIGLSNYQDNLKQSFFWLLSLPFKR
ncbi:sterol desaturase family protein [Sneathiella glossodoripedis]|uniref:sterol desaturase family protein n=1 Tax=Sneathiella glossodoripedis TaxID=418853 RepID=UPI000566B5D7|nr:sterol desaturase family protein [Sneathiella glossodoripedis]